MQIKARSRAVQEQAAPYAIPAEDDGKPVHGLALLFLAAASFWAAFFRDGKAEAATAPEAAPDQEPDPAPDAAAARQPGQDAPPYSPPRPARETADQAAPPPLAEPGRMADPGGRGQGDTGLGGTMAPEGRLSPADMVAAPPRPAATTAEAPRSPPPADQTPDPAGDPAPDPTEDPYGLAELLADLRENLAGHDPARIEHAADLAVGDWLAASALAQLQEGVPPPAMAHAPADPAPALAPPLASARQTAAISRETFIESHLAGHAPLADAETPPVTPFPAETGAFGPDPLFAPFL